ncbi:tetratricopeptide repeat protein [Vreelandella massiliensis]|uniref:tetratricopeptide repeat protein n=1 Tax=Vreelandella massiliensis TaxID=1816686 RepID=UPI00096A701C|nr:tetratricopeptide repeat protein [Halomonas massiliensis]
MHFSDLNRLNFINPEPSSSGPQVTNVNQLKQSFLHELKALGEEGDSEANFMLGLRAYNGADKPPNVAVAAEYWQQAAKKWHLDAIYNLALLYLKGKGVDHSPSMAIALLYDACSQHHPGAINRLGCHYWWGDLVQQDREKSLSLFVYARQLGSSEAAYNLGIYCLSSNASHGDIKNGIWYLSQAAKEEQPDAMARLATFFEGEYPEFVDHVSAKKWRELAATFGHIPSQLQLASGYLFQGEIYTAYNWLREASAQGHEPSKILKQQLNRLLIVDNNNLS